jgi:CheY-like chemotaxis protein
LLLKSIAIWEARMATILVVDDYRNAAETTATWLGQNGHSVHVASDGYQAIEISKQQRPDVVLLDIGLPRMDGYRVASTLRGKSVGHRRSSSPLRAMAGKRTAARH